MQSGSPTLPGRASGAYAKRFREGTDRAVPPGETLERIRPHAAAMGITRVAVLTGLDRIGLPVVAVCRPNGRSLAVSQGKGLTLDAAKASGIMESIESYHAEHVRLPLVLGSLAEVRVRYRVADVSGLARQTTSRFHPHLPILWAGGVDLATGDRTLVPYELVHLDLRAPLPTGSGAFFMGSNGLASGNCLLEATSHAICELVERDANTLWRLSGPEAQAMRRIDLGTVVDGDCRAVLDRFRAANVVVAVWNTTSDVGIPSILATIVDGERSVARPMVPVSGSGCHPRPAIALLRALTEAAQGRLTLISGSRDDLSQRAFDPAFGLTQADRVRDLQAREPGQVHFDSVEGADHDTFDEDVSWELEHLARAGMREVVAVNLTHEEVGIPIVRVVVPYLEAMSEAPGFVPGVRARRLAVEAS